MGIKTIARFSNACIIVFPFVAVCVYYSKLGNIGQEKPAI